MQSIQEEQVAARLAPLPSETYVEKTMPQILSKRDMLFTFVVIIFFITNVPNAVAGGAAGITFWIAGALTFLLPCVIITAQLGIMFPHEGSLYNWTNKAFGPFMGFFATFLYWIPNPLLILATSDLIVSYLQGLNSGWLTAPWQQGLVLSALIILSALVAQARYRVVQNMINITVCLLIFVVLLIVAASMTWLLNGHHSATDFSQFGNWTINWTPWWNPFSGGGNFGLFGLITLGYLGVNIPLNMAGEMLPENATQRRRIITSYLIWGPILATLFYILVTAAILIVQGQQGAYMLFSVISTIDMALGKVWGNIATLCVLCTFFLATVTYNFSYARLLMCGGIDQRLPAMMARLNKNRVPTAAIWIQTFAAVMLSVLFFVLVPLFVNGTNAADLVNQVYFVGVASATLLWACGTLFLFFNMLRLLKTAPQLVRDARLFSATTLKIFSIVGIVAGGIAIVDTILNSWTPLIPNGTWLLIIGGLTIAGVVIGAIGSMFATSEAAWQDLSTPRN
ncbi:amino acid permease [Dictyobacter alpinus]|uniref:Amino acid permease n=1 Tax=Dictyobacter alpinus TaxID=2014873 RepID=A0A402BK18_9CHLR|nr:APC family permease [Dictyobacter alpinus]GCE31683.1 amino acid permease [Dictyobacter alpinus]